MIASQTIKVVSVLALFLLVSSISYVYINTQQKTKLEVIEVGWGTNPWSGYLCFHIYNFKEEKLVFLELENWQDESSSFTKIDSRGWNLKNGDNYVKMEASQKEGTYRLVMWESLEKIGDGKVLWENTVDLTSLEIEEGVKVTKVEIGNFDTRISEDGDRITKWEIVFNIFNYEQLQNVSFRLQKEMPRSSQTPDEKSFLISHGNNTIELNSAWEQTLNLSFYELRNHGTIWKGIQETGEVEYLES